VPNLHRVSFVTEKHHKSTKGTPLDHHLLSASSGRSLIPVRTGKIYARFVGSDSAGNGRGPTFLLHERDRYFGR